MTPEAIARLKASYASVTATPRQLAARFYESSLRRRQASGRSFPAT
jgi:hypothetical protein